MIHIVILIVIFYTFIFLVIFIVILIVIFSNTNLFLLLSTSVPNMPAVFVQWVAFLLSLAISSGDKYQKYMSEIILIFPLNKRLFIIRTAGFSVAGCVHCGEHQRAGPAGER